MSEISKCCGSKARWPSEHGEYGEHHGRMSQQDVHSLPRSQHGLTTGFDPSAKGGFLSHRGTLKSSILDWDLPL